MSAANAAPTLSMAQLLAAAKLDTATSVSYTITEHWMQGRTTYGGLSAALCLDAALKIHPDLPPLRSAQITFVGPVGGKVSVSTNVLRRGKSVSYIHTRLSGESGIGTEAVFCFGASRESKLNATYTAKPKINSVADSIGFFGDAPRPVFTDNFDCLLAAGDRPISNSDKDEIWIWVKHKTDASQSILNVHTNVALLALADMPPPAVLPKFASPAPISSMTWMVNFLQNPEQDNLGWWLLRSAAENAQDGYSSQDMQVWDSQGNLVISGRQSVTLFY